MPPCVSGLGLALVATLLGAPAALAADGLEVIVLKDGQQVIGEVLSEKPGALFVDLGFDVLKIPRDQVSERRKPDEAPAPVARDRVPADVDPSGFYKSADLKSRPVKDLVREYGEGVVLIETPGGTGSGFVVNEDGYVVTNNHVIEGETRVSVVLFQQTESGLERKRIEDVEIVALNPFVDLALLKMPTKGLKLKPVYLGGLDDLNAGDGAFAVGNPLGLERSVSQGIISTLNRNFEGLIYLQTDAAINPGNSGGPLFNLKGEVVGVTNMGFRGTDNLGFAIPINYVKDFLRNRVAFAYDKDNPNTGFRYLEPPRRRRADKPPIAAAPSAGAATSGGTR